MPPRAIAACSSPEKAAALSWRRSGGIASARAKTGSMAGGSPGRRPDGGGGASREPGGHLGRGRAPAEGPAAGEQLVRDDREGVDVARRAAPLPLRLLGDR